MNQILHIAADEWRYWFRSQLALGAAGIFLVLVLVTSLITAVRMEAETHTRTHQQTEAEQTFLSQPDRHPHRMVHYGHYLFRAPAPLAMFDPGLDTVTGQSIFLEGHRQNTVMFAESAASANFGGLAWLSPALVYQIFTPIIIILLGHSAIVRERESGQLVSLLAISISGHKIMSGKALALLSLSLLLLIPLIIGTSLALANGEDFLALLVLFAAYFSYLALWVFITLIASIVLTQRSATLATLTAAWFGFALVLPSVAVNVATGSTPAAGKIETDLAMLYDLRKLGDGHNENDPAFQTLRSDLLEQYKVKRIEDLPINFRGIVAFDSEEQLTKVLNEYAEERMQIEAQQDTTISRYSMLTPVLAIAFASRSIAGTDLAHYHRFQREAEAVRYDFVQGLNQAHVEKLSYQTDISRNKDEESSRRARVDASNWQVLDDYQFQTADIPQRMATASYSLKWLLTWLATSLINLLWLSGRIKP
ncbi:ABC transporter permease [Aurantivibrio plasticivorans]